MNTVETLTPLFSLTVIIEVSFEDIEMHCYVYITNHYAIYIDIKNYNLRKEKKNHDCLPILMLLLLLLSYHRRLWMILRSARAARGRRSG